MRVGFFGGTFDPPHVGHLAVARAAAETFNLDRMLLVPTSRQPLKEIAARASYRDRLTMVSLLCKGEQMMEASSIEAPSSEAAPNYTIDTVRQLRKELNANDELYVVIGADSFLDLRRWREPDALLQIAEWIVVSRPGFPLRERGALELSEAEQRRVHLLTDVNVPVSATQLRACLRAGEDCAEWIPADVLAYISAHNLYGRDATA